MKAAQPILVAGKRMRTDNHADFSAHRQQLLQQSGCGGPSLDMVLSNKAQAVDSFGPGIEGNDRNVVSGGYWYDSRPV